LNLNEPIALDPGTLSASERTTRGIDPLPTRLGEAIEHLRKDGALLDALGPELSKAYIAVREAEWNAMKDWTPDQEAKLLLDRY
jgi:glutamine synthetase